MTTVLSPRRLRNANSCSFSVSRNVSGSSHWSAGFSRRAALSVATSGSSGPSSFRCFSSYFSESRYSSEPGRTGTFSQCSNPE